jgi:hypothetical protein
MVSFLRRHSRKISITLLCCFLTELSGNVAFALTSGPSQPETQQFAPAGMDNMVDPFTGDFSYNIPLMDVGGYPININYASGITPDAEASWVGLGWNLNVGAINRSVRGLPDDFAGDQVVKEYNTKPNQTWGTSVSAGVSFVGFKPGIIKSLGINKSLNLFYNNYNGFGISQSFGASVGAGASSKAGSTASLGVSLSLGSETGLEVTPTIGISSRQKTGNNESTLGANLSFPFSTREGLKGMTLSGSLNLNGKGKDGTVTAGGGLSSSAFMGFAAPTYTPSLENDMYNVNVSTNFSVGISTPVTEFTSGYVGYYAGEFIKDTRRSTPAYGYQYSGLSSSSDKLMDFNREKDSYYNKFTTNLAITNYTYDIFQVSGQGVGGTYRLHRGDVGSIHDAAVTSKGYSPGLGFGISFGVLPSSQYSVDVDFNYSESNSGKWLEDRSRINAFRNEKTTSLNKSGTEVTYFKKIGEMAPEADNGFLNQVQNQYGVVRHELSPSTAAFGDGQPNGNYVVWNRNPTTLGEERTTPAIPSPANNRRLQRRTRTTAFTTLTVAEADKSAILPIENYERNNFNWQNKSNKDRSVNAPNGDVGYKKEIVKRTANGRKAHHISESRVTDEKGTRYIYGIPAYNTLQEEVTFAIGSSGDVGSGLAFYTPGRDDGIGNKNGLDHYFNKVTTPAFAHSYLLTCILSADYVDRDNIPGPSDGDLGSYTKFNYTRHLNNYRWRTPFSATPGVASYSEGMAGTPLDDKGNYLYGEKEIWYLHSIETRTHVAEFYLKDRLDGKGAEGRHGGIGAESQQYLEKIVLYSKPDKKNGSGEPIKVVHFEYDYSLCPQTLNSVSKLDPITQVVENANKGKLTLKKIWFTYGKSQKGVLNPYTFQYAQGIDGQYNPALNPAYSFKNYDRWGNYKTDGTDNKRNAEFPYADQNKSRADQNIAVYALSSIKTPTGGTMRVYYESDDYAYVQNKQAMRMFSVIGTSSDGSDNSGTYNYLYTNDNPNGRNYLIIDLGEGFKPTSTTNPNEEFRSKYLSGIDLMYYKFFIQVVQNSERKEYVPGYAVIDYSSCQLLGTNTTQDPKDGKTIYTRALIKLNPVDAKTGKSSSRDVNPIVRNAWMYARLNLGRELRNSTDATDGALTQVLTTLLNQLTEISQLFRGFVSKMIKDGNSSEFVPAKSFVRLNEPDKIKIGGGHRVKALVMADNWGLMKASKEVATALPDKQTSYYGQAYDYTFMENGVQISAGVAAYEPILGNEENPFRRPVFVREKVPLGPSKEYYLEEPFGESFFPSPTVGYRRVTVTPLKITTAITANTKFVGNGTGRVEHEFYTAYDFPSITKRTELQTYRHKPNILFKFMKLDSKDLVTCSQGYYVELNDMHGKQKAQRVYAEAKHDGDAILSLNILNAVKPISEVEYRYKVNADGTLNNRVTYVDPQLNVIAENSPAGKELATDVDMVQDERYSQSSTKGGGAHINLKWVQVLFLPIFLPPIYPQLNNESTRFRALVTTKVVNKCGILESTTAKDNGASITTKNLAWDLKTGQVLLTQVQNEFHEPIYNFTYPGHWAYERFQLAADNEGLTFNAFGFNALKTSGLKDGDELYLQGGTAKLGYLFDGSIVSSRGIPISDYGKAKVIRSGARNTASVPIATVTTLQNPIQAGSPQLVFTKVLNAGVSEYSDQWKRFCNCPEYENSPTRSSNPYILGTRGNLRPVRSWTYLTERVQSQLNNELNIRKDGYFKDYTPYWTYSNGKLVPPADAASSKWQSVTNILNYNSTGMEIENSDALNRRSMAQFGYARNLPVATSNNSRYKETGYDGFEDYDFGDCEDDHFSWRAFAPHVTNAQAHTGKNSILVAPKEVLSIRKVIDPCDNVPKK